MSSFRIRVVVSVIIAAASACGGSSVDVACDKDDGNCFARNLRLAENGAALSTLDIGTPCNTVVSLGTDVVSLNVPGAPPPAVGGTLSDGFYVLTKREQFVGSEPVLPPSTTTRSETIFVSNRGSTMQFVRREGSSGAPARGNRLLSVAGSKMTVEDKCPKTQTSTVDFSVVGNSIVIYESSAILSTFSIAPAPPSARPAITNKPGPITLTGSAPTTIELTTASPWQCRPALCFGTLVKSEPSALTVGIQSRTSSCIAAPKGSAPGTVKIDVSYRVPPRNPPQALGLQIFPVSSPDCATTDVLAKLVSGDSAVTFGEAIVVDQTINQP